LLAAGARAAREGHTGQTGPRAARGAQPTTVLTVFRLADPGWADRGLPELLAALPAVRRAVGQVRLVVAGRGPAPEDLRAAVAVAGDVELVESPDDAALAALYASADLCVPCRRPGDSGDGYGLVLTEAQLAGCPVVGPVSGGSRDAYLDGVTGATPGDVSPAALAAVLRDLLTDRARLARMRRRAAEWARMATEPAEHTRAVFTAVLAAVPVTPIASEVPTGAAAPAPRRARAGAAAPSPRRGAQVWPERDDVAGLDLDQGELAGDDVAASRGWSDDIEADDLAGR
jgi:hypothetical protein